ncbi:MAG: hypothetical protein L6416_06110 [Candidatus Omnitrophica bacterium]|nr:hypothetical protein [Candidatus Omnitrophota bacterium]
MFRRRGGDFHANDFKLISALFEVFQDLANNLVRNNKYDFALICYDKAEYICDLLLESPGDDSLAYWQKQKEVLRRDKQKYEAVVFSYQLQDNRLMSDELDNANFVIGIIGQAI